MLEVRSPASKTNKEKDQRPKENTRLIFAQMEIEQLQLIQKLGIYVLPKEVALTRSQTRGRRLMVGVTRTQDGARIVHFWSRKKAPTRMALS